MSCLFPFSTISALINASQKLALMCHFLDCGLLVTSWSLPLTQQYGIRHKANFTAAYAAAQFLGKVAISFFFFWVLYPLLSCLIPHFQKFQYQHTGKIWRGLALLTIWVRAIYLQWKDKTNMLVIEKLCYGTEMIIGSKQVWTSFSIKWECEKYHESHSHVLMSKQNISMIELNPNL